MSTSTTTPNHKGVAFVTGAAAGIGRAIALRLADDGYELAVNDLLRSKDALDQLTHEIFEKHGKKVESVIGDVSVESEVEAMIACVVEDLGGLDIMVANAGICIMLPFMETTLEDWERQFSTNVRGTYLCYKYAGQQMISQGRGGRIIGASSVVGKQGEPLMAAYSATKFAIRGLTQAVAKEFGPYGITVNAYAPGAIDTPLLQNLAGNKTEFYEQESKRAALGHIGTPAEIASIVSYLVSPEAHFITGQSISVNGGRFFD
ncbi:Diacetyl reductase [(S)-acetoin forming] [Hypsizygus marmoreus]|uniref:Diacetyl reductase [(S)-acetoin forming] n=1 Tax=Hypsizygus marmoreus TaxID=39966 RepID=A0A369JIP6_HYPMA|nr:Diacetyl reductase [(S)-acetoin forming] [Hypsizygus marmoreus]